VAFAASSAGQRILWWQKNGTAIAHSSVSEGSPSASNIEVLSASVPVQLAAGDYVELVAYQNSGGNLNVGNASFAQYDTWASVILLATQGSGGGGGAALTVTDESGTVSDTAVTSITVPDGTLVDNGTGDVTLRTIPTGVVGCYAFDSGTQSIPNNALTAVDFDSESVDSDGFHENVTNPSRITIPAGMGGTYVVGGFVMCASNASGVRIATLAKNGTNIGPAPQGNTDDAAAYGAVLSSVVELAAGDYLELKVYQSSGGALDVGDATNANQQSALYAYKLGSGTVGEAIGAKARATSTQSLTDTTEVKVALDTADWDTDGYFDNANDRLTVPAGLGGKYLVDASGYFASGSYNYAELTVYVNGTEAVRERHVPNNSTGHGFGLHGVLDLDAGDYVELYAEIVGASLDLGHATVDWAQVKFGLTLLATAGLPQGDDYELDYAEKTTTSNVTATTEGTADTLVTGSGFTADGSTPVLVEFYTPFAKPSTTGEVIYLSLFDNGSPLGQFGLDRSAHATDFDMTHVSRRLTPSAGAHTYSIRAFVSSGTGQVGGGVAGSGAYVPMYMRVTLANPVVNKGGQLSDGLPTGTAFPSPAIAGQRYRRSDLDYEVYFYDGTRWLSEQKYILNAEIGDTLQAGFAAGPVTGWRMKVPFQTDDGFYLQHIDLSTYVGVTNDGSNYWTFTAFDATGTLSASTDTSADTAATYTEHRITIDAVAAAAAHFVYLQGTETGSAGTAYVRAAALVGRKIAT
jgi:hypothetical protein